jgi:hypothetical protein
LVLIISQLLTDRVGGGEGWGDSRFRDHRLRRRGSDLGLFAPQGPEKQKTEGEGSDRCDRAGEAEGKTFEIPGNAGAR